MKSTSIDKIGLAAMLLFFSSMIPVMYVGAVSVKDARSSRSATIKRAVKYDPRVGRIALSSAIPKKDAPEKIK